VRLAGRLSALHHMASTPSSPLLREDEGLSSPGLDISGISLHIALDTPQRERTPDGENADMVLGTGLKISALEDCAGPEAECDRDSESNAAKEQKRRPAPPAIETDTSAGSRLGALQTPNNITPSPAALQRETWSALSTASSMSMLQLQAPAHRRDDMAKVEEELLSLSGGALICLYSEDMAPLVSVAHGMQLPRAQIGLLGACFTSCRSNSFELSKIHAGDSTITYRSLFGGRVLAVVILSSWGGTSGTLMDVMLQQVHDGISAAVHIAVGEHTMVKLLEAGKISHARKALKPASLLFQHLLTGRTQVAMLTRAVGAIPHLSASLAMKASSALQEACSTLSAPSPACACILVNGKIVCATRSWFKLGAGSSQRPGRRDGNGMTNHGANVAAADAERSVQLQVLLLHLLAANVPGETNVAVLPVEGLSHGAQSARELGESRACARRADPDGNGAQGDAGNGERETQTARHRLLVMGLAPGSPAPEGGSSGRVGDVQVSDDWRLCLLLPDDDGSWAMPSAEIMDCARQNLEDALYPLSLTLVAPGTPSSLGAHRHLNSSASADSTPVAALANEKGQSDAEDPETGPFAASWWAGIHAGLRRLVLVRSRQFDGKVEVRNTSSQGEGPHSQHGPGLFWDLAVPGGARVINDPGAGMGVAVGDVDDLDEKPCHAGRGHGSSKSDAYILL
jgi:hypothetical protein